MDNKKLVTLDKIYRKFSIITKVCNFIGMIAVYAMMALIVLDVFFRNFMPSPLQGIYEIVQWFLLPICCITFFGYAYGSGIMPRVTMFVEKFKPSVQHWITNIVLVINIAMFALMTYAGVVYVVKQMAKNANVYIGANTVEVWPIYWLLVVAFVLVVIECIFALIKNLVMKDRVAVTFDED